MDNAARVLAAALSERLPQPVIVDNRAGADGTIAAGAVVRSAADGLTLLVSLKGAMTVAPSISKLSFDPLRDLTPLATIAQTAEVFVARPRAGITSMGGVAEAMRRNGGKLSIGYIGAYPRLLSELTLTTAIRTAAMSALAARVLARPGSRRMALQLGTGLPGAALEEALREVLDLG